MDSKRIMKEFARNRTAKCLLLVFLCAVTTYSFAERVRFLNFNEFNRAAGKGSKISSAIQYNGMPTDKLSEGLKPPPEDKWEIHSTVTTGLFPLTADTSKKIVFMFRSEGHEKARSILFTSIRYFDEHGVLLGSLRNKKFSAPYEWMKGTLSLEPKLKGARYAEVWFVKFQDADCTGLVNHPIYLSGVGIK